MTKSTGQMKHSKWYFQRGFSLMELLVVLGAIGVISSIGLASFGNFNSKQAVRSSAENVKAMLQTARLRALSQVKPQQCLNETLAGYEVTIDPTSSQYSLNVVCDITYTLESKKLPRDITFQADSTRSIFFPVLIGNPSSVATIILIGNGASQAITIDAAGSIALAMDSVPTMQLMPTPTPIDCPWWEWWTCADGGLTPAPTSIASNPTPTTAPFSTPVPTAAPTPIPTATTVPTPTSLPTPTPTNVPTPTPTLVPPPDIIIDNTTATVVGSWSTGTSGTDKYGTNYRSRSRGSGSNYVQYTPSITRTGDYNVYEWHPGGTSRPTDASYIISYSGGSQTFRVNQQTNGGRWNLIGRFRFASGTSGYVRINDVFTGFGVNVVADAIKFEYAP